MALAAYRVPLDFVRSDAADNASDQMAGQRSIFVDITPQGGASQKQQIYLVRPPVILVPGLWTSKVADLLLVGQTLISDGRFTVNTSNYGGQLVAIEDQLPTNVPSVVGGSNLGIAWAGAFTSDRA
jgi:hypothetical protein